MTSYVEELLERTNHKAKSRARMFHRYRDRSIMVLVWYVLRIDMLTSVCLPQTYDKFHTCPIEEYSKGSGCPLISTCLAKKHSIRFYLDQKIGLFVKEKWQHFDCHLSYYWTGLFLLDEPITIRMTPDWSEYQSEHWPTGEIAIIDKEGNED